MYNRAVIYCLYIKNMDIAAWIPHHCIFLFFQQARILH